MNYSNTKQSKIKNHLYQEISPKSLQIFKKRLLLERNYKEKCMKLIEDMSKQRKCKINTNKENKNLKNSKMILEKRKKKFQSLKTKMTSPRTVNSKFAQFGIQITENEEEIASKRELNRNLKKNLKYLKKNPRSYYKDFRGTKSSRFFERINQLKNVLKDNIKIKKNKVKELRITHQRTRSEGVYTLSYPKSVTQK